MEIEVKKLSSTDVQQFSELMRIFSVVFEMQEFKLPAGEHLQKLLDKSDFVVMVASVNDKIIGGLTVYVLDQYYSNKPVAYIYDVGVAGAYQRKGVGKKLIDVLLQYCKDHGIEEAFVEAEADDLDAVRFYRKTPFSNEIQTAQFKYFIDQSRE